MWKEKLFLFLSIPAYGIIYILTAIIVVIIFPLLLAGLTGSAHFMMKYWAHTIFLVMGRRLHIEGIQNVKKNGRYILVANHTSLFDIVAIISFIPGLSWFGHERLTRIPVFSRVLKMINYVPMRKSSIKNTKEMIDQLVEKSEGHTIGIFPEGTRSLDGKMNDFYRGFVILLRNADVDVLPVTLNGFYNFKPKNRFHIDFLSKLEVEIHKPILRSDIIHMSDSEIIEIVKSKIESQMIPIIA